GLTANRVRLLPPRNPRRDILNRGAALLKRDRVFQRKWFAQALFLRAATIVWALIEPRDECRVRAELLDIVLHGLVEAGNEGCDEHDDAHAEDHAENRQHAAHLVGAQRVQSLLQVFAMLLCHWCLSHPRAALRWDRVWLRATRDRCQRTSRCLLKREAKLRPR